MKPNSARRKISQWDPRFQISRFQSPLGCRSSTGRSTSGYYIAQSVVPLSHSRYQLVSDRRRSKREGLTSGRLHPNSMQCTSSYRLVAAVTEVEEGVYPSRAAKDMRDVSAYKVLTTAASSSRSTSRVDVLPYVVMTRLQHDISFVPRLLSEPSCCFVLWIYSR